jgi:hypothetical protein
LVVAVSRDEDTGEQSAVGEAGEALAPGEPVGRVNLPDEPEQQIDPLEPGDGQPVGLTVGSTREKVLFGLMAVVMMILAMVVILQGVFEQKMPI